MSTAAELLKQVATLSAKSSGKSADKTKLIQKIHALATTPVDSAPAPSTPSTPSTTPSDPTPTGPDGAWKLTFAERFDALDKSVWATTYDGSMNNLVGPAGFSDDNVKLVNSQAQLAMSGGKGAVLVTLKPVLPVGGYTEARLQFPHDGNRFVNWPAWWATVFKTWPKSGEHDIGEVLGGQLTANYHSPSGAHNQGSSPGDWTGFHTYGVHRKASSADVYWDGKKVQSYATDDDGAAEFLCLNMGTEKGSPVSALPLIVDWVRVWTPA